MPLSCSTVPHHTHPPSHTVRKGAFKPGQSARFAGKILYEECRTPVYTPSAWDPALAVRSADLPDVRLTLEFAYGYAGEGLFGGVAGAGGGVGGGGGGRGVCAGGG